MEKIKELPRELWIVLAVMIILTVGCSCAFTLEVDSRPAKAQMPPLYVDHFLPYVAK